MGNANKRGLGGPFNNEPWTGDPLMPLTIVQPLNVSGTAINESGGATWANAAAANLDFDVSETDIAGDRMSQPQTKTPAPDGSVTVNADGMVIPQGVYLAELFVNIHVTSGGGEYKFAVCGPGAGSSAWIYSWRSAQLQDLTDGWSPGTPTDRTLAKFSVLFDTSEYIADQIHAGKTRDDLTYAPRKFGMSPALDFRLTNNHSSGTGTATMQAGSYLKLTRLANAGCLSKANSDL